MRLERKSRRRVCEQWLLCDRLPDDGSGQELELELASGKGGSTLDVGQQAAVGKFTDRERWANTDRRYFAPPRGAELRLIGRTDRRLRLNRKRSVGRSADGCKDERFAAEGTSDDPHLLTAVAVCELPVQGHAMAEEHLE